VQVFVSPEVNNIIDNAVAISTRRGRCYVGVEHLFEALTAQGSLLPRSVHDRYRNVLHTLGREIDREAWRGTMPTVSGEIFYTPRCAAVTNEATRLANRLGSREPSAGHLLLAILSDAHALPSRVMDRLGLDRGELVAALTEGLRAPRAPDQASPQERAGLAPAPHTQGKAAPAGAAAAAGAPGPRTAEAATAKTAEAAPDQAKLAFSLESVTRDLTQAAQDGKLEPAVGRDDTIFELLQILARQTKNNAILVGEAGVGKTKIVEGLALLAAGETGSGLLSGSRILELDIGAFMSDTKYRGVFEEKLRALVEELKKSKDAILFIDEIHLIMGAGATDGDGMDMANLLKPALARGEIRCIGATTIQEYRKFIEKDPALERRFQMVRVEELSETATYEVLRALRPSLERHHRVHIGRKALHAAVKLTQRYMPNRQLPDKAIDVLDQACARYRLKAIAAQKNPKLLENTIVPTAADKVTPHDVRKVVSQITAIPMEEISAEERILLGDLERRLRERIIGQDEAVSRVVAAVRKSRVGLADPKRPDAVMLFLGPSGVGKTELAKALADIVFGSLNHLATFDMSEYVEEHSVARLLGAPPGYVGSEEEGRLTGAVRKSPFSVLLFDEIEKAHRRVFDVLLPVFDEGQIKDSRGRVVSFRNCIIILTSNIAADLLRRGDRDEVSSELLDVLRAHFRPEFINRIDEIVPFYPLLFEDVRAILRLSIHELRSRLHDRGIKVRMYQRAYEHLAQQGYSEEFGARELRRCVERLVTNPASDLLTREDFKRGDVIEVLMHEGELVIRKGAPANHAEATP